MADGRRGRCEKHRRSGWFRPSGRGVRFGRRRWFRGVAVHDVDSTVNATDSGYRSTGTVLRSSGYWGRSSDIFAPSRTPGADRDDRQKYLELIGATTRRCDANVLAWALMSNHVHLVVRVGEDPLERLMKPINTGYAGWKNRRAGRLGPVFAGRFRSPLVDEDGYLLQPSGLRRSGSGAGLAAPGRGAGDVLRRPGDGAARLSGLRARWWVRGTQAGPGRRCDYTRTCWPASRPTRPSRAKDGVAVRSWRRSSPTRARCLGWSDGSSITNPSELGRRWRDCS